MYIHRRLQKKKSIRNFSRQRGAFLESVSLLYWERLRKINRKGTKPTFFAASSSHFLFYHTIGGGVNRFFQNSAFCYLFSCSLYKIIKNGKKILKKVFTIHKKCAIIKMRTGNFPESSGRFLRFAHSTRKDSQQGDTLRRGCEKTV